MPFYDTAPKYNESWRVVRCVVGVYNASTFSAAAAAMSPRNRATKRGNNARREMCDCLARNLVLKSDFCNARGFLARFSYAAIKPLRFASASLGMK